MGSNPGYLLKKFLLYLFFKIFGHSRHFKVPDNIDNSRGLNLAIIETQMPNLSLHKSKATSMNYFISYTTELFNLEHFNRSVV